MQEDEGSGEVGRGGEEGDKSVGQHGAYPCGLVIQNRAGLVSRALEDGVVEGEEIEGMSRTREEGEEGLDGRGRGLDE